MGARTLLDDIMPDYDVASRHTIRVAASPEAVYRAARTADLGRPWVVRLLMGLRAIPAVPVLLRQGARRWGSRTDQRSVGPAAFTLIAEVSGEEFVLGIMGRFWTATGGVEPTSASSFHQAPPPGLAQGVWNFRVTPSGQGTELSTETRVRCGDDATRRHFGRYWAFIRLGSGLVRRSMLRHIRAAAERGTG